MKRKTKKKKSWVFLVIISALMIYIFFVDSSSFLQRWLVKRENAALKEEIIALEEENERLRKENKTLETDKKSWEQKAREFGMQKKGEEIFLFKKEKKSN